MTQHPLDTDDNRMRRYIANLTIESDYDYEYANHPPPTDSEAEIQIDSASNGLRTRRSVGESIGTNSNYGQQGGTSLGPTPEYVTDTEDIVINRQVRNARTTLVARSMCSTNNLSVNWNGGSVNTLANTSCNNSTTNLINHPNNLLYGLSSHAMGDVYRQRNKLKDYGLKRLSVRQHIIVTICRDIPLYSMLKNIFVLIRQWYKLMKVPYNNVIAVRATEFFLASLWCLVSALISYTILDGLMVRWMVMYDIQAAIVRILSSSLMIILTVELFNYTFNNSSNDFCLTVWILISCVFTFVFILQCFLSNNLVLEDKFNEKEIGSVDLTSRMSSASNSNHSVLESDRNAHSRSMNSIVNATIENFETPRKRGNSGITEFTDRSLKNKLKRKVDMYNLVVFAVVPIGVASFVSMIGLVRLLLIIRLDVGMEISRIQQST